MFSFGVGEVVVQVSANDTRRVREIAVGTGFISKRPKELREEFDFAAECGKHEFLGKCTQNGKYNEFFGRLYDEIGSNGNELAVAVSLSCGARKSEKLANGMECLSLERLLFVILIWIWTSTEKYEKNDKKTKQTLRVAASELSHIVSSENEKSFDVFGNWYNSIGFEKAPWLELLDLGKWPAKNQDEYVVAFDLEAYADDAPLGEVAHSGPSLLRVHFTALAVARLRAIAVATGLYESSAETIADAVLQAGQKSKKQRSLTLSEADVFHFFSSLASKHTQHKKSKLSLDHQHVISHLCYALREKVPNTNLRVDAYQLAAGLTLFCAGSKSSKLAAAWDLIASRPATKNELRLNARGLWRFIRSFLIVLLVLAATTEEDTQQNHDSIDTLLNDADAAGFTLATLVFDEIPSSGTISFDDFADWYTRGGYNRASWFELLDLHKWAL